MKLLVLLLAAVVVAGSVEAKPPIFTLTDLGEVGDRAAISSKGVVAVGFLKKPGFVRTPDGRKTPLQKGFIPATINGKAVIGGQISRRAALVENGKVTILDPETAPVGPTKIADLSDGGAFLFGKGAENKNGAVSWSYRLRRGEKTVAEDAAALADDGGYVTRDSSSPERVRGEKRLKLPGLEGQDWTHATDISSGGVACGYTESSGPGYVNAVWWDAAGTLHRLSPPGYRGEEPSRHWFGARAERINARGDVLGTATPEAKWPVGVKDFFCRRAADLTVFWPKGGSPLVLEREIPGFARALGLADDGTILAVARVGKRERLFLVRRR